VVTTDVTNVRLTTVSAKELQSLADRLYSRGVSSLTTCDRACQCDLVAASRTIRALLTRYERSTGRQLEAIMIAGGV
jgi:hypothetical protein